MEIDPLEKSALVRQLQDPELPEAGRLFILAACLIPFGSAFISFSIVFGLMTLHKLGPLEVLVFLLLLAGIACGLVILAGGLLALFAMARVLKTDLVRLGAKAVILVLSSAVVLLALLSRRFTLHDLAGAVWISSLMLSLSGSILFFLHKVAGKVRLRFSGVAAALFALLLHWLFLLWTAVFPADMQEILRDPSLSACLKATLFCLKKYWDIVLVTLMAKNELLTLFNRATGLEEAIATLFRAGVGRIHFFCMISVFGSLGFLVTGVATSALIPLRDEILWEVFVIYLVMVAVIIFYTPWFEEQSPAAPSPAIPI